MRCVSKMRAARLLVLLAMPFGLVGHGLAQAVYGNIYGTVTDASGATLPQATVTVTDVAKGTSTTIKSNDSGEFTADHLIPDTYTVKVESQGFKSFQQADIRVFADTSVKVTAALQVGSAGETVNVSADQVPELKTDRADVSTTFTSQEIVDLPIPDRNFTNLQLLLPGAQLLGWSHAASENPQGSKQIEVDGQAFAGVAFQLDGTDNQDPILGIIVINPNSDSLSETKITTQNFDAEFGKAVSSVVTAQTKSGTNSFHGSAFDYRQSNANLARDPFNQGPSQLSAINPFPSGLRNQFGGSIGGPILKNKAFFFGDYQGVRQKVGISNLQTVPSAYLVQTCLGKITSPTGIAGCDFSEYYNALPVDPNTGVHTGEIYNNQVVNGVATSQAFPGHVIPAAQLSPQALKLLNYFTQYAPNNNGGRIPGLVDNYAKSGTGGFNSDQWDARGDYQATERIHAFGRFSRFTDTLTGSTIFGAAGGSGFGLGGYGGTSIGANDSAAAGADIAINNKLVTDIRLGYFRYNIGTRKYDQGTNFADQLGIPGMNTGVDTTSGAPDFNLTEVGSFGLPNNPAGRGPQYGAGLNVDRCNCPLTEREDQYQLANNWTREFGNHSVKFGADIRYARNLRVPSDNDRTGILQFGTAPTSNGNGETGLGFASFVLGDVSQFNRYVSTSTNAKEFQKRDFFYGQDTWRATQKLTVNYGLRYEMYFPETINNKGQGAILDLNTGYLRVAGVGGIGSNMNYQRPANTYNPRIGLAYQANPSLVIRAGYGRSFDIGVFGSIFGHTATQNLPVLANQTITTTGGSTSYAFSLAQGPAAPTFTQVPSNGLLPNPGSLVTSRARPDPLRLPTLDAWNASLQQSITPTLSLTIAYVGNKGTHTFGDSSGNTTNPNEPGIFVPSPLSPTGTLHYTSDKTYANSVAPDGATGNTTFLRRYYTASLPACSDPNYATPTGAGVTRGECGWTNDITNFSDNLNTHYNALQVTASKQLAHGYTVTANYAWQQAIAYQTGFSTWSLPATRGRSSDLRQQQVIVYGVFQLPFGRNKALLSHANGFVNQLVSGFEINPIVNYGSGLPFSLTYSTCGSNLPYDAPCWVNGNARAFHPHVTGIPGNKLSFYDPIPLGTNGFTSPSLDQIGNVGRNTAFGPHFFNTDLSVQKNFPIRESVALQLRADAFNAFNHINYGNPNSNIDQGGAITGGPYPPGTTGFTRQMQFSGRVQF